MLDQDEQREFGEAPGLGRSKLLWRAALVASFGYAAIAGLVIELAPVIFDYNGKPVAGAAESLSAVEMILVTVIAGLGFGVLVVLKKAWRAEGKALLKSWDWLPLLIAFPALLMALFALGFAVSEIVN